MGLLATMPRGPTVPLPLPTAVGELGRWNSKSCRTVGHRGDPLAA